MVAKNGNCEDRKTERVLVLLTMSSQKIYDERFSNLKQFW
jgi:hypothetical protein